jgi:PAS domain S-box-containing protein
MESAKIMVVEDEGIIAQDIKNCLENLGYSVPEVVFTGREAIEKAGIIRPDLILMDIVLKGEIDGIETAAEIKSRYSIPIVYLTAYEDDKTLKRAKLTEPLGYILKPFEERYLRSSIEMALYKHKMESKLKESERWLGTILKSVGEAVIVTDDIGKINFMNPTAELLTGWGLNEASGKEIFTLLHILDEDTKREIENPVLKVLKDNITFGRSNHALLIARNGKEIPIDHSASPMRNENGAVTGVVLVLQNIFDRKKAEHALKDSENKYRNLFDYATDAIFVQSLNGKIISVNNEACNMLNYTKKELYTLNFSDIVYNNIPDFIQSVYSALDAKGHHTFEAQYKRKDGSMVDVEVSMRTIKLLNENVIQSFVRDITARKKSQKEIIMLAHAVKGISECISITDLNNKLIFVNDAFIKTYGYTQEELLGKSMNIIRSQKNSPQLYKEIRENTLRGGWNGELINLSRDGREFPVSLSTSVVRDDKGVPTSYIGIANDITERKRLEHAIRDSEKDYKGLFENAHDAIIIFRPSDEIILDVNQSACEIYGYTRAEFIGLPVDIISDQNPEGKKRIEETLQKGKTSRFETKHRKKDGTEMLLEINATVVDYKGQRAIVSINRDITERRKAELGLIESEKRYRNLTQNAPIALSRYSIDEQKYIYWNEQFFKQFGYTLEEYNGYTKEEKEDFMYPDDRKKIRDNFTRWKDNGYKGISHFDYREYSKNGDLIWVDTYSYADFDEKSTAKYINAIYIDITERKRIESIILESERKYKNLAENAPISVGRISLKTRKYEYVNEEFVRQSGYTMEEMNSLSGIQLNEMNHPEDEEKMKNFYKEWSEKGFQGSQHLEYRVYRKTRELIWLDTYLYADFDDSGNAAAINQICIDITKRKNSEIALRQSENKYRNLTENAPIIVTRYNLKTFSYEFVNDEFVNQSGFTMEEFNKLSPEELQKYTYPEDLPNVNSSYENWAKNNFSGTHHIDYRAYTKSGQLIWMDSYMYADFEEFGKPYAINQICIDITDRKEAEAAIIESEQKYKNLAVNAPIAVTRLKLDTRNYDYVNGEFIRQSGYTLEEYNNLSEDALVEMMYFEDREKVFSAYKQWTSENYKGTLHLDYRIINRFRKIVWLDTYLYADFDNNGNAKAINEICIDVTEQKKAQAALRESDKRFRALIENSSDMVALLDTDGVFLYASPSTEKILGYDVEKEYEGKSLFDFIYPGDLQLIKQKFDEVNNKPGNKVTAEFRYRVKNGEWIWIEGVAVNMFNEPSINAVVVNYRDITERKKAEMELKLQKSYFQQLFENSPEGIVILDNNDRVIDANKGFEQLFRYSLNEIKGKTVTSFLVPQNLTEQASQISLFVLKGEIINRETVRKRKDGSLVDVSILGYPITLENNQIGVYGIYRDISERKETEKALRNSEERYKAFVKQSSEGIWRFELLEPVSTKLPVEEQVRHAFKFGYLAECNDIFARMYGYKAAEEVVGAHLSDMLPESDPRNIAYMRSFVESNYRLNNAESHEVDKEGNIKVFLNNLVGIVENDFLIRSWGTQKDITEIKKAEEELKSTQLRLATLLSNLPDVVLYETGNNKEFITENVIDLLGYPANKFIEDRRFFHKIMHPGDSKDVANKVREWHKAGDEGILNTEFRVRRSDGTYIWLEDHMISIKEINGRNHMAGVLIDVNEHKKAEEKLKQLAEKLSTSNKDLEQFAYVASHDLQEPLRMVASYIQLLQRRYKDKIGPEADEFINYAVDGVVRMKSLINDLLIFSRVNTRELTAEPTDCNLVLEQVKGNLRTSIEESGTEIIAAHLPTINANKLQLTQLFQNLISNAIKFRGDKSPIINVTAKCDADEWLFSVSDNGIGIDKEFSDKIFVIFQRLHNYTEYPGTGIGLAICKKIVEKLGGHIWVESEPGVGSTFNFTIPLIKD